MSGLLKGNNKTVTAVKEDIMDFDLDVLEELLAIDLEILEELEQY